ncbi:MAG TPA: cache domain-containing protein, partial [Yoonia sp.]|nr:cache domain-containing protein [Yoonia sp.]
MTDLGSGRRRGKWYLRLAVLVVCLFGVIVIYVSNQLLTQRFTETISNRSDVRLALYVTNLMNELQRNSVVPQLLSRDPDLIKALENKDYSLSTARLLSFVDEIGAASLTLLDRDGRAVAATDRNRIGTDHRQNPYFVNAQRSNQTVYTTFARAEGGFAYVYSRRVELAGTLLGVIMVEVNGQRLETGWAGVSDAVLVMDSEGTIIMSTEPRWRGLNEEEALARQSAPSAIERAIRATQGWAALPADAYLRGEAVLRREMRVPHQGWRMVSYTTYDSVRERVNGILALEVMGIAILLALLFWGSSRRTASRLVFFQRESAELRALNRRLQREIAER